MFSDPVTRGDLHSAVVADDPLAEVSDPYEQSDYDQFDEPESDEPAGFDPDDAFAVGDDYHEPLATDPYLRDLGFGDTDPVLLVWPQQEFDQVDQRWPEVLEPLGADSWDDYRRHYQTLITRWTSRGLPLSMVVGTADGFADWLVDQGTDPVSVDLAAMADAYGGYLSEQVEPVELPPAATDPCWCGSGDSYRQCCRQLVKPA